MRAAGLTLLLLMAAGTARAEAPPGAQEKFDQEKKSVGLAITLEAISPIAGMGCFYGGESDKATVLALVSTGAIGAGVGGAVWFVHLRSENSTGFAGVTRHLEEGTAISLLVAAGVTYVITRISGLSLAPDATRAYNEDLRQRVGLPASEPTVPFHAWATVPSMSFTF